MKSSNPSAIRLLAFPLLLGLALGLPPSARAELEFVGKDREGPEATYHGIPLFWPQSSFEIDLPAATTGEEGAPHLWLEILGRGALQIGRATEPNRVFDSNPELAALVRTWRWERYSLTDEEIAASRVFIDASPHGDLFLGRFCVAQGDAVPGIVGETGFALGDDSQLLQGVADFPDLGCQWSGAFLEIYGPDGALVERTAVDDRGFFSTLTPTIENMLAGLLDRNGVPLSAKTPFPGEVEGYAFQPLPRDRVRLWSGLEGSEGIRFDLSSSIGWKGRHEIVSTCFFEGEPSLFKKKYFETRRDHPTLFVEPLPPSRKGAGALDRELDFLNLRNALAANYKIETPRFFFVAEGEGVAQALTLLSSYRDFFGGAIVWGGRPGRTIPSNFVDSPVALLGSREDLASMADWAEKCREAHVPLLEKSYWSTPGEEEVEADIEEAVGWLLLSESDQLRREIEHSCYTTRHGRRQWLWITELETPGNLSWAKANWLEHGLIQLETEGVRRVRVALNNEFAKNGNRVTITLGRLSLPVTISSRFEAVELLKDEKTGDWLPRFVRFAEPVPPARLGTLPAPGIPAGADLDGFALFCRNELGVGCAWGYKCEMDLPPGPVTIHDLFEGIEPVEIVEVSWTEEEIESYRSWLESRGDLSTLLSGHTRGTLSDGARLRCALSLDHLRAFLAEDPSDISSDWEPLGVNRTALVGRYLAKKYR